MQFNKKNDRTAQLIVFVLSLFFAAIIGFFVGSVFFPQKNNSSTNSSESLNFGKLNKVVSLLNENYYYRDKLKIDTLQDTTLKGLLAGLGDAPTRYLNVQEYKQYTDTLAGNIFGIGVEIGVDGDGSKIYNVFEGSPAQKAGIKVDDFILKVDGKDVSKMYPADVATLVRGPINTKVTLTIRRGEQSLDIEITRDKIHTDSITFKKQDNNICTIQISRFTDDTLSTWKDNWDKAIDSYINNGCQKLIIDLRNNGGGYVEAAKYSLEEFLDDGKIIYGQKDSSGNITYVKTSRSAVPTGEEQRRSPQKQMLNTPLVILVNSNSASASEIFSGSLQNLGRAKLVGSNTYGKGSVQTTYTEFGDGSALIYTIANWTLPNGQVIDQNYPIKPDFVIIPTEDDTKNKNDVQLNKALDILK